jgi:hypothetical protein
VDVGAELALTSERRLEPACHSVGEGEPARHRPVHKPVAKRIGQRPGDRGRLLPGRLGARFGLTRGGRTHQSQAVDRVTPAVHERATAERVVVPDVGGIPDRPAGPDLGVRRRPDRAIAHKRRKPPHQRVVAVVHGLHHDKPVPVSRVRDPHGLGRVGRERLLAQHVLALRERAQRPRRVQRVGQRQVDGVDLGGGQQLLVRPEHRRYLMRPRVRRRPVPVPSGDRRHRHRRHRLGRLDQRPQRDPRGTQNPYPHPVRAHHVLHHGRPSGARASSTSLARSTARPSSAAGSPTSGSQFMS